MRIGRFTCGAEIYTRRIYLFRSIFVHRRLMIRNSVVALSYSRVSTVFCLVYVSEIRITTARRRLAIPISSFFLGTGRSPATFRGVAFSSIRNCCIFRISCAAPISRDILLFRTNTPIKSCLFSRLRVSLIRCICYIYSITFCLYPCIPCVFFSCGPTSYCLRSRGIMFICCATRSIYFTWKCLLSLSCGLFVCRGISTTLIRSTSSCI